MTQMQNPWHQPSHSSSVRGDTWPWTASIVLSIAVGSAYLLAALFSLALLTKPDCVAVFWPAAGIATGTLVAIGPKARLPVALAVLVASAAASLLKDRNYQAAIVFALCNAGEVLLVAWVITQRFGQDFKLDSLRNVLTFFAAAGVGPAISAILATAGFVLFYNSRAPVSTTWLNWFASDALGIIMVAPLFIGLGRLPSDLPKKWELAEGTLTLVALVAVSTIAFGSPAHYYTVLPLGLLLPALLAAHCRPVFAAAAALILGCVVVWTSAIGIGDLGEISSLPDRAYAARATLLAISTYTLVLAALFAERRHNEAALEDSNNRLKNSNVRLQLALDGAELGVWSLDAKTGRFESDARDGQIHGYQSDAPPNTLAAARPFIHPGDLPALDAAFAASKRTGSRCKVEYRLAPTVGDADLRQERWVALEGTVVRDANGQSRQLLGVTRDISERKKAELALEERNLQLALAGKAGRVGSYAYSVDSDVIQVSAGYAALHGLPEGTTETTRNEWRARAHPEDLVRVEEVRRQAFRKRLTDFEIEYRILRSGESRWIESRSFISYNPDGSPRRVIGVNIDVTDRKRAEDQQRLLVAELDHRVKNVLATVSAILTQTQDAGSTDFVTALDSRIKSLARTHELLSQSRWNGVSLAEIVRLEFAPYAKDNVECGGPSVTLKAEAAQAMAMVLHELTTNAAKYGAFSNRNGRVSLLWRWLRNGSTGRLAIEWRETGGPQVQVPSQSSYGTAIIRELIPFELGGTTELAFASDGVRCRMELLAEWVSCAVPLDNEAKELAHAQR
jgi:PAS domain S-box-containing protein